MCVRVGRGVRLFLIYHVYILPHFFFFLFPISQRSRKLKKKERKIYICAVPERNIHRNTSSLYIFIYIYIYTHSCWRGPREKEFFGRLICVCSPFNNRVKGRKEKKRKKKDLSWFGGGSANKQTNIQDNNATLTIFWFSILDTILNIIPPCFGFFFFPCR